MENRQITRLQDSDTIANDGRDLKKKTMACGLIAKTQARQSAVKLHYDSSKDAEFPGEIFRPTILMSVFVYKQLNFVFPDGSRGIKACQIIVQTLPSEQGHNKATSAGWAL